MGVDFRHTGLRPTADWAPAFQGRGSLQGRSLDRGRAERLNLVIQKASQEKADHAFVVSIDTAKTGTQRGVVRWRDLLREKRLAARIETLTRISSFGSLPSAWAGRDSYAPSSRVLGNASVFIERLPSEIPLPQVRPTADGEISFTWIAQDRRLDVTANSDGQIEWASTLDVNPASGVVQFDGAMPADLIYLLRLVIG